MKINLNDLKKEIPFKYKVQSTKGSKASVVAYIDARDAMDLLDKVVGPANWQDSYRRDSKGALFCTISILIGGAWVSKEDLGIPSQFEGAKGEVSDAFKRAAVKWGVGRFLYDMPIIQLPKKQYGAGQKAKFYPCTNEGSILWDNEQLTDYIVSGAYKKPPKPAQGNRPKKQAETPAVHSEQPAVVPKDITAVLNETATVPELNDFFRGLSPALQKTEAVVIAFADRKQQIAEAALEEAKLKTGLKK